MGKDINKQPSVSVVMPAYNSEKYIAQAINSILHQTYKNWELVIVDDASTDETFSIIKKETVNNARIKVLRNKRNRGISRTLNKAILNSSGKYIAIMHSDDISLPNRLEMQVKIMEKHHDIGVCGTGIMLIDEECVTTGACYFPSSNEEIKATLLFRSPLAHPSVCFRKSVLSKLPTYYDGRQLNVNEDYEFWSRLIYKTKFANLHRLLLSYRIHSNQQSIMYKNELISNANKIRVKQLKKIGILPTKKEIQIHNHIALGLVENYSVGDIESWLLRLISHNKRIKYVDDKAFGSIVGYFWLETMIYHKKSYLRAFCSPLLYQALLYVFNKIKSTYII